jgi:hypothetical protein
MLNRPAPQRARKEKVGDRRVPIHDHTDVNSGGKLDLGSAVNGGLSAVPGGSPGGPTTAAGVSVEDAAGWFTAIHAEGALAELAAKAIGYQAHGNMGATETFDAATGWHSGTFDANCTFTLTANTTGTSSSLFLELTQDGTGGWTITLPASVVNKATLEAAQDTTLGSTSFLVLLSRDGGTTWWGGWWGQGTAAASLSVTDGVTTVDPVEVVTFADSGIASVTVEDAGSNTATVTVSVTEDALQSAGHYELLMTGSSPPEPLEDGTGTDWLYVWVNG